MECNDKANDKIEHEDSFKFTQPGFYDTENFTSYIIDDDDPNAMYVPVSSGLMNLISKIRVVRPCIQAEEWVRNCSLSVDVENILKSIKKYDTEIITNSTNEFYLQILLLSWTGYSIIDKNDCIQKRRKAYCNIYKYLLFNWNYLEPFAKFQKVDENDPGKHIVTSCSYKVLKSLFNFEPTEKYIYRVHDSQSSLPQIINMETLMNWPFLSIKIDLPNFVMLRKSYNHNDFKIVNLEHDFKSVYDSPMNTLLHYKPSKCFSELSSSFIILFFHQFKTHIHESNLSSMQKDNIFAIISEFLKDMSPIKTLINIKMDYFVNLAPYPYVRYLGHMPSYFEYDNKISTINKDKLNVRVQQTTYPALMFQLEKFCTRYKSSEKTGRVNFEFSTPNFSMKYLEKCVTYECQLCCILFNSTNASYEVGIHFINQHGYEPNWECTKCSKNFSTEMLSKTRWYHECCTSTNE